MTQPPSHQHTTDIRYYIEDEDAKIDLILDRISDLENIALRMESTQKRMESLIIQVMGNLPK